MEKPSCASQRGMPFYKMLQDISVREGILLGGRKNFALKITNCPENTFFSLIRMEPETSYKSVLYS